MSSDPDHLQSIAESLRSIARSLERSSPPARPVSPTMDVADAAEKLGTSVRHVRELIARKAIPFYKVGALIHFDDTELNEWLQTERSAP